MTAAERSARRTGDLVLTVALLIAQALVTFVLFFMTALLTMGCSNGCTSGPAVLGFAVAAYGPIVALIVAASIGIRFLVKRRLAFWVPLAGIALAVACYVFGGIAITG